jgi:peptidoglycan hydrolase-like protein with peptidoglycan-binding domain
MLRKGSSGDEVALLQKRLAAAGFDAGAADGVFGPKTEGALKAFQGANGLAVDGIAGPATNGKLAELQAAGLEKLSNIGKADEGDTPAPL